ncbi:MAG TPA: alpha/beta hydrolase [Thermoanaerobaculia bacterium]|nr:alpha/beta hydrolase [Thermoanaerobaculia bacterium]
MSRAQHTPRPARRSRRRWIAGLALSAAAVGLPLLLRRRRTAPALPPHGWGRGLRYAWRGQDVHFQQTGDRNGLPVVLVHSLGPGHDSAEWHRAAELMSQCCELLAPDLPGWGRSAACCQRLGRPTAELYVGFLRDFLADVVRRPAILVGAGRGASFVVAAAAAALAAAQARGAEQPVRALALVSPLGIADAEEGVKLPSAPHLMRLARVPVLAGAVVPLLTTRRAINRHLKGEVFAAPERADAAQRERHFRSARQPGTERSLLAWLAGDLALDVSELLPQLTVPVWIGWGRQSIAPPVETADLWLHLLPQGQSGRTNQAGRTAQLEIFEGCGPLPHLEAPVEFSRRLEPFIQAA